MLSVDQEIAPTSAANLKRTHRLSTAMQRTSEWSLLLLFSTCFMLLMHMYISMIMKRGPSLFLFVFQ